MIFRHRLALALGCRVTEIGHLPPGEYQDWIKYYNAEPWGFPTANQRHGETMMGILRASPNKFSDTVCNPKHWMYEHGSKAASELSDDQIEQFRESVMSSFPTRKRGMRRQQSRVR